MIIFVTTKEDHLPLVPRYKGCALDFIPKDDMDDMAQRVKECLTLITTGSSMAIQVFTFKQGVVFRLASAMTRFASLPPAPGPYRWRSVSMPAIAPIPFDERTSR